VILILMGVAGAGKTTVGRALADRLGWPFIEADDFHPAPNIEKMRRNQPLSDADRIPWLTQVHEVLKSASIRGADLIVACSALREHYRLELVRDIPDAHWIFLRASRSLLYSRLSTRQGHFAGLGLLDSQLAALEPPLDAITVDADQPIASLVDGLCRELGLPCSTGASESQRLQ
jgi:gluconokinase